MANHHKLSKILVLSATESDQENLCTSTNSYFIQIGCTKLSWALVQHGRRSSLNTRSWWNVSRDDALYSKYLVVQYNNPAAPCEPTNHHLLTGVVRHAPSCMNRTLDTRMFAHIGVWRGRTLESPGDICPGFFACHILPHRHEREVKEDPHSSDDDRDFADSAAS